MYLGEKALLPPGMALSTSPFNLTTLLSSLGNFLLLHV